MKLRESKRQIQDRTTFVGSTGVREMEDYSRMKAEEKKAAKTVVEAAVSLKYPKKKANKKTNVGRSPKS